MPTALTATAATIYAAILLQPEDDTLRTMFADALDDAGDHDRAEFIRLQCCTDNPMDCTENTPSGIAGGIRAGCPRCLRLDRESQLLAQHGDGWRRGEKCSWCEKGQRWVMGTPYDKGEWNTCEHCHGTGYTSPLSSDVKIGHLSPENPWSKWHEVGWSRGLIASYSATHAEVFTDDGPSEWACDVARFAPIERVVLVDRPAWTRDGLWTCLGNYNESHPLLGSPLADAVYKTGYNGWHITEAAANDALALAVAQIVRRAAFKEKR